MHYQTYAWKLTVFRSIFSTLLYFYLLELEPTPLSLLPLTQQRLPFDKCILGVNSQIPFLEVLTGELLEMIEKNTNTYVINILPVHSFLFLFC